MAHTQCPTCQELVFGRIHQVMPCTCCGNKIRIPPKPQVNNKEIYKATARRKCNCGAQLIFNQMNGGLFNYRCPACGYNQNFF